MLPSETAQRLHCRSTSDGLGDRVIGVLRLGFLGGDRKHQGGDRSARLQARVRHLPWQPTPRTRCRSHNVQDAVRQPWPEYPRHGRLLFCGLTNINSPIHPGQSVHMSA